MKLSIKLTARDACEGERIPWGYGVAWFSEARDVWILLPIPLNVIVCGFRRGYYALASYGAKDNLERRTWKLMLDRAERERDAAIELLVRSQRMLDGPTQPFDQTAVQTNGAEDDPDAV